MLCTQTILHILQAEMYQTRNDLQLYKNSLSDVRSNLLVHVCSSMADDFYQNFCVTQEI